MSWLRRISEEPPFRLLSYFLVRRFSRSPEAIDRWGAVDRPHYYAGVLAAAKLAKSDGVGEISVAEFGVAGGSGLVRLQAYARRIAENLGVRIRVFGFDTGEGLPSPLPDYRDHPDQWRVSDYKMDVPKLRSQLAAGTELVLGNIDQTLPEFLSSNPPPFGFISCDVDLYSSAKAVLRVLTLPNARLLRRVFIYFDDLDFVFNHRFAGEWLAIEEFNRENANLKIDVWRGIRKDRVFRDDPWLDNMFVAHDLEAISAFALKRQASEGCELR